LSWGSQKAYQAAPSILPASSSSSSAPLTVNFSDFKLFGYPVGEQFWRLASQTISRHFITNNTIAGSTTSVDEGVQQLDLLSLAWSYIAAIPPPAWGYCFLLAASLLIYRRKSFRTLVKVILLFVLELVLMPICLGWVVQWSTQSVFADKLAYAITAAVIPAATISTANANTTMSAAANTTSFAPNGLDIFSVTAGLLVGTPYEAGARIVARWLTGFIFMLIWARVVRVVRDSVRPGLLWFIRFNDDPEWSLFRSFVQDSVKLHIKRTIETFAFHATAVLGIVYAPLLLLDTVSHLPIWLDTLGAPVLFPVSVAAIQNYKSAVDFALLHVALPLSLDIVSPRHSFRGATKGVIRWTSRLLGLEGFVMPPPPAPPADAAGAGEGGAAAAAAAPERPRLIVVRMVLFIFANWQILLWTIALSTGLALVGGRFVVRDVLGLGRTAAASAAPDNASNVDLNAERPYVDLYHLVFGIYLVSTLYKVASNIVHAVQTVLAATANNRNNNNNGGGNATPSPALILARRTLRALPLVILGGIVIPILAGVLLFWTLFLPHAIIHQHLDREALNPTIFPPTATTSPSNTSIADLVNTSNLTYVENGNTSMLHQAPPAPDNSDIFMIATHNTTTPTAISITLTPLSLLHVTQLSFFVQAWCFGIVLVKLLARSLCTEGLLPEPLRIRLQAVLDNGIGERMNLRLAMFAVVIPVIIIQVVLLFAPPSIIQLLFGIFRPSNLSDSIGETVLDASRNMFAERLKRWQRLESFIIQFSHLIFTVFGIAVGAIVWLVAVAIQSYRKLRDERYVVGHQLHNRPLPPPSPTSQPAVVNH
jgi:hypothetical protein